MLQQVEGLGHVHKVGIDFSAIPHEVVDGLNSSPSTHFGGATRLVSKLKLVNAKRSAKQEEYNRVKKLQNKTTHGN